jgi:hypothetical protein
MRLNHRAFLASAMLSAILVVLVAIGASASSPVKITNCIKANSRPKTVTLTCGDGNTVLSKLSWSSFGGKSARANGTFETNTCSPNCAEGKVVRYPVKVSAGDTRSCKSGLRVYNKLALQFTGPKPKSANALKHWTLGCPT